MDEEEMNFIKEYNQNYIFRTDKVVQAPLLFDTLLEQRAFEIKSSDDVVFDMMIAARSSNLMTILEFEEISKQNNDLEAEQSKNVKFNQLCLRKSFFANFLRMYFEQAIKANPNNYLMRLQYAYYALVHLRNMYLCINILRDLDFSKLSWHDKVNLKVNEIALIQELENLQSQSQEYQNGYSMTSMGIISTINKKQIINKNQQDLNISPEHFINISLLYDKFNHFSTVLNQNIIDFWKLIDDKDFQLNSLLSQQRELSNSISLLHEVFENIESVSKKKDPKIYYYYALLQKQLLNDDQACENMLHKYKSIRNIQRVLQSNYRITIPDNDMAMIVCMGGIQNFGKLLICNQMVKKITGFDNLDLRHQTIEMFMPPQIREAHKEFLDEFNKSGQNSILSKNTNVFMMNKNETCQLVNQTIRYHYSQEYDHCFVAFIQKIDDLQIWNSSQMGRKLNKIMFLLADNIDGKIFAFSKTCTKYLGIKNSFLKGQDVICKTNNFTLNDICPMIDLNMVSKSQIASEDSPQQCRVFEGQFDLDISYLPSQVIREKKLGYLRDKPVKFKLIKESYFDSKLEINILALQFIENMPTVNGITISLNDVMMTQALPQSKNQISDKDNEDEEEQSSSSSNDGQKSQEFIKSKFMRDFKTTPQLLKIAVQLIIFVFMAMICISSVNFYLAKVRNTQLEHELDILHESFKRSELTIKCKVSLQSMLLQVNGYEIQTSKIVDNKYESMQQLLFNSQEDLRNMQSKLESEQFDYSIDFNHFLNSEILPLEYLNEDFTITQKNQTMTIGINILVTRLLEVYNFNKSQLKGNLSIQTLQPAKAPYKPSFYERTIHFASYNSIKSIRKISLDLSQRYIDDIKNHSNNSQFMTEMTLIGSICAIVIVGFIVTPILTKIQDKQFISIGFFFSLKREHICLMQKQASDFYEQLETYIRNDKKVQNEDDEDEIQQQNMSRQQLFGASLVSHQDINLNISKDNTSLYMANDTTYINNNYARQSLSKSDIDDRSEVSKIEGPKSPHTYQKFQLEQSGRFLLGKIKEKSMLSESDLQSRLPEENSQKISQQIIESDKSQEEQEAIDKMKIQQIKSTKLKRKFKVFLICLFFIVIFSLYFIGTYIMQLRIYSNITDVVSSLKIIYQKSFCPETVYTLIKESQIKNTTKIFPDENIELINQQILTCYQYEQEYGFLRVKLPDPFKSIESYIQDLESDQLCTIEFSDPKERLNCQTANNGILMKGLSNTAQYILSHFQQINLKMSEIHRNETYLKKLLLNEMTSELMMMKLNIIEKVLQNFYLKSIYAADTYFRQLINQYLIIFVLFLSFLFFIVTVFFTKVYKSMRLYLWQINMSLKILPIQKLPQEAINDLKVFLSIKE
ncbi:pas domain s-box family protein [Stylonychia lemnae]|uniref:Pas domain s-box family protein n=1 Tax=Stylonychia lemnae TaxID=5949 RepID=A0A078A457_STYLE|nr:pas domain s-box family protein [Stylonychia lemnae]|eukprot:CDW75534.1 pas domain s-box family protein [Stylonychia lemnae]